MQYRIVEMKDGGFDVEKCRLGTCWNKAIYIRFPTYEEAHNNGSEYTHLNFYNQSSDDYINKLKNNPFGELYAVSKQDRDNYEVKPVDNHDEDKDSYVGRVTEIRLENDKEAVKKIQDWLDGYSDKKEKKEKEEDK